MNKNSTPPSKSRPVYRAMVLFIGIFTLALLSFSCGGLCKQFQEVQKEIDSGNAVEAQRKYAKIKFKKKFGDPSFKEFKMLYQMLEASLCKLNLELESLMAEIDSLERKKLAAFLKEAIKKWGEYDKKKIDECIGREVKPIDLEGLLEVLETFGTPPPKVITCPEETEENSAPKNDSPREALNEICKDKKEKEEQAETFFEVRESPKRASQPAEIICAEYDFRIGDPFDSQNDSIIIAYGNEDEACLGISYFEKGEYSSERSRKFLSFLKERLESYFEKNNKNIELGDGIEIIITGTADKIPVSESLIFRGYPPNSCNHARVEYYDTDSYSQLVSLNLKYGDKIEDNKDLAALRAYEVQCVLSQIEPFRLKGAGFKLQTKVYSGNEGAKYRWVKIEIYIKNARSLELERYFGAFQMPARSDEVIMQEEKQDGINQPARNIAIVIGVKGEGAVYADKDAENFTQFLYKEESKGHKWQVYPRFNEQATKEEIIDLALRVNQTMGPRDQLYFFYSGLSVTGKDRTAYFLPYRADWKAPEVSGINSDSLFRYILTGLDARQAIFFIDGHPTAISGQEGEAPYFSLKFLNNIDVGYQGTAALLNATAKGSASYEGKGTRNGLFTQYLIKGLERDADGFNEERSKNEQIDLSELAHYLLYHVGRRSKAMGEPIQVTELQFYKGR